MNIHYLKNNDNIYNFNITYLNMYGKIVTQNFTYNKSDRTLDIVNVTDQTIKSILDNNNVQILKYIYDLEVSQPLSDPP